MYLQEVVKFRFSGRKDRWNEPNTGGAEENGPGMSRIGHIDGELCDFKDFNSNIGITCIEPLTFVSTRSCLVYLYVFY